MPWLLDPSRPNLHWRVLIDLIHRPSDSRAVAHARGGANASGEIAALLEDLLPDGAWSVDKPFWDRFSGPGWRLVAAVQLGADPTDPRLQAASHSLLEEAPDTGGFAVREGQSTEAWFTARVLQALAALGWCRHIRFQEAVAWLDEEAPSTDDGQWLNTQNNSQGTFACRVTPVALLDALTACGGSNRGALEARAVGSVSAALATIEEGMFELGYPNFDRTDAAEAFAVLARSGAGWDPEMLAALTRLQALQIEGGRWARGVDVPAFLPIGRLPSVGAPSKWITLEAATGVLRYAVEAGLPRRFPKKPS